MSDETPITELTELEAVKVSGVHSPANGTPFLLLKAASEQTAKSDSEEADEIQEAVSGETAKADIDESDAEKATLSDEDRDKMDESDFAYVDPDGGKHLPVHDEAHVRAALGRFSQTDFSAAEDPGNAKAKAARKIKSAAAEHGITISDDSAVAQAAAKKGAVQDALHGTDTPERAGDIPSGTSGLAGAATGAVSDNAIATATANGLPGISGPIQGGQSTYAIPAEARINAGAVKHAAIAFTASTLAEAIEKIDQHREADQAVKADDAPAVSLPGSAPWESLDSVTLADVAGTLAHCAAAIDAIQKRETVEAVAGDPSDWFDAWDLQDAQCALDYAIGIAARLAFVEQASAQAAKGDIDFEQLTAAREGLTRTLLAGEHTIKARDTAGSPNSDQEDTIMATEVTKEELAEAILAGTDSAVEARIDALKTELSELVTEAVKNANNGGDIDAADIKADGEIDEHLNGVSKTAEADSKGLTDQIADVVKAAVAAETADLRELVVKMGKRPRQGGPILDGQIRPDLARQGTAVKSDADGEIERLEKQFSEATDPAHKANIGEALTLARFRQHAEHQFG